MVEPAADVGDVEVAAVASSELGPRRQYVFAVLLAAGIRMLSRGDEPDRVPRAVGVHLVQRVGEERVPVAHADVDAQRTAGRCKALAQASRLELREPRDWRYATEQLVMTRDFFDSFGRYPAPAQHIGQERPHVLRPLRAAKRDQQDGVEHLRRRLAVMLFRPDEGLLLVV